MHDHKGKNDCQKLSNVDPAQNRLFQTKTELDKVSPSFCLAKWKQVTLHLQTGFNHSCHHPKVHKTSLDELAQNASALHNTNYKKELRAMMLKGERPSECEYCWKVEDSPGEHFSDRIIKSADDWAFPQLHEVAELPADANVNPSYVEVSFGSECNFRCVYCCPSVSSSLWRLYETHGPYAGRPDLETLKAEGKAPIKTEENPYVQAFWNWYPDLSKDLKTLRITGGEPLLNPNTFKLLQKIQEDPLPQTSLCINSNLGIAERFFERFLTALANIKEGEHIKDFRLFTSIDTHGEQAEYLRSGLKYPLWKDRVRRFLKETSFDITYMVTFNALSVPRFTDLLKDLIAINRDHLKSQGDKFVKRTFLDISYLMYPMPLAIFILTPEWIEKIGDIVRFMEENSESKIGPAGFSYSEIHKMKRVYSVSLASDWSDQERQRQRFNFLVFLAQCEQREGRRFLDYFPEMTRFTNYCLQRQNKTAFARLLEC